MSKKIKEIKGVFIKGKKQKEFLDKCQEYVSKAFEKRAIEEAEAQRKNRDFRVRACTNRLFFYGKKIRKMVS